MPHAAAADANSANMSSSPLANGDKPSSLFISHLSNYPVVSDAVKTYKTNHYGAKSLDVAQIAYDKFAVPFLPYLRTPYSILHPYLSKADSIADTGLTKVDETFPVVKEETSTVKDTVFHYAFFPLHVAGRAKDYAFNTYADEHKKVGGEQGVVKTTKAVISTELRIALETVTYAINFFSERKDNAKQKYDRGAKELSKKLDQGSKELNKNIEQGKREVHKNVDQGKHEANKKVEQGKKKVDENTR